MLGKTKGFLSYLAGIPGYIWYVWGEFIVKKLFPRSFKVWFAADLKAIEDIQLYLQDREVALHEQLEQKNKSIEAILNEKNKKKVSKKGKNGSTKKHKK